MTPTGHDWLVGREFGGWTVRSFLARGGMASVWTVDHTDGRRAVLKVPLGDDPDLLARAAREGRIQGALDSEHIVRSLDEVDVAGRPGTVLEWVTGGLTLESLLARGRLDAPQGERLFEGILMGVEAAHARGFIHRDLKPSNVLLAGEEGRWTPKIADFGLARPEHEPPADKLTRAGYILGSAAYMAPEQARDAASVDARADLWSLGCILYEIVGGRPAFPGERVEEVLAAVVAARYAPLDTLVSEAPARAIVAVDACLQVDPQLRPTDVATLRAVWRGEQKWVTNSAPPRKATPRRSGPPSLPERARAPATPPPPAAADAPRIHEGRDSHATSNATFVADRPSSAPRRWPALVAVVVGVFVLALAARLAMG